MSGLRRRPSDDRTSERGQGLVEFAIIVPVFMLLLLGMLEFGFIFDQTMQISYATREGARSGSAFASGNSTTMICNTTVDVDKNIIAAVQRVLKAPGSRVVPSQIQEIRIFRADANGRPTGDVNHWTYRAGAGPTVDGARLDFVQGSAPWNACTRLNGINPDSLGVAIEYTYRFTTPLASWMGATLAIGDQTVMALNPTNK